MLSNGQPLDQQTAVSILTQVADALDYAHSEGIVHRDVKPANILVRPDGKAKITDFGIARITSHTVTRTGFTLGTPAYMSPEQIMTAKVSGQADQYSLGVLAYQMLSGKTPFAAETGSALMLQILMEEAPVLHNVNPAISPRTSELIAKAMAKKPEGRFAACREFAERLSESINAPKAEPRTETPAPMPAVRKSEAGVSSHEGAQGERLESTIWIPTRSSPSPPIAPPEPVKPVLRAGTTKVNPKDGLTYVWIPPGTFQMGRSPEDSACYDDEKPAHEVTISSGFWMGQTVVTQEAYQRRIGINPSFFKGAKLPVENITWDDAQSYCQVVGMRLPTEAEWEYAARAGSSGSRYGDLDGIAWYSVNSEGKTHEVGGKQPNLWGLHDMLGNVWEWVADWSDGYPDGSATDPQGPANGTQRVLRGGAFGVNRRVARVSLRFRNEPANHGCSLGFRCVGD